MPRQYNSVMSNTLKVIKGDDSTITVTFKNNGVVVNITSYTVFFTVKKKLSDVDADAVIKKDITSHTDPTNGKTSIVLTSVDTGKTPGSYYWDLQLKAPSGAIASTQYGVLEILQDVTIRTT